MPGLEKEIVVLSAVRTPFGKFCNTLKDLSTTELNIITGRTAIVRAGVRPEEIDHVIFGNAQQTSVDAMYLARHIGLKAGVPPSVPALTVDRVCGSRVQSIVSRAQFPLVRDGRIVLCGRT